ncbi:1-acyl-sn-glycerol-3-phosphate acyltransferase [Acidimangrovimonas pyrenivorans]|uniref:Glycerol-3-phosphate acyltransferase n=1 Tax=Acidimangrovimonas pyrenivorans TaxID=2030798 RepID=A0ABV7AHU3_9RHOB
MTGTVELPIWLVVLALVLAVLGALDRVLAPSMRWVLRRRMERAVARLNERLQRPIQPFKLMRRQDMIVRLLYDPAVTEAIAEHAHETGVPEPVAAEEARGYAREIVPAFSTLVYFGIATRLARWLSRALYRVRIGQLDASAISEIDPEATVVFVMNHRSNMDYVLVTWLAADRSALSYAVGEWARVWPLSRLIRAMGAYFIHRKGRNALYRKVLARYVQMATAEGVTQAIFPEGGLSLDGRVGPARMGLLHYMVGGFTPGAGRDVVFMPVALGYDRVVEDRVLTEAAVTGERRFRGRPMAIFLFILRNIWRRLTRQERRFGYAAVSFGTPVSLARFLATAEDPSTEALADHLMAEVTRVVPVLPVPLAAAALGETSCRRDALIVAGEALAARLRDAGVVLRLPKGDVAAAVEAGLSRLARRKLVRIEGDRIVPVGKELDLLRFYAAPVRQLLEAGAASAGIEAQEVKSEES